MAQMASTGFAGPAGRHGAAVVVTAGGLVITTATAAGGDGTWLRLAGEADLSDCGALRQALAGPVAAAGDVDLDLAELAFADVAVTRVLAQTAARLAPERNLVLHRASPPLLRLMHLCWPAQAGLEVIAD